MLFFGKYDDKVTLKNRGLSSIFRENFFSAQVVTYFEGRSNDF
jgi:hypothetical protein